MSRMRVAILTLTMLAGAALLAAWYIAWPPTEGVGPRVAGPDELYSNILPADYVGPNTCGACHAKQHRLWSVHPHRFMNQLPSAASIKGDFADHTWKLRPGYTVTFSTQDGDYLMTIDHPTQKRSRYKVTRTV